MEGQSTVVVRVKRQRDDEEWGDFVLCEERGRSAAEALQGLQLQQQEQQQQRQGNDNNDNNDNNSGVEAPRKRLLRHVGRFGRQEAEALLLQPSAVEELLRQATQRTHVKQMRTAPHRAEQQTQRVRAGRLRLLQERRLGDNATLLEVDHYPVGGKRPREEIPPPSSGVSDVSAREPILCNGRIMQAVNVSLADEQPEEEMYDLYVEQRKRQEISSEGDYVPYESEGLYELRLEHFWEETAEREEDREDVFHDDDVDQDNVEVDYPSSSASSDEKRGDHEWARDDDYDEERDDVENYYGDDPDEQRDYDRSLYLDEEFNDDRSAPWNYWT